jgi:competence protein ComGC
MKQKNSFTRIQMVLLCLLMLSTFLLVSACSGMANPGSQPNNQPSNGSGYSLIQLVNQQIQHFVTLP